MPVMRNPRSHFAPLAIGAPDPVREIPVTPSRMIHFFDPSNEKMRARVPDMARSADVLLGNLEDAIAADKKEAARAGLVEVGETADLGGTPLWTRVNALESPWVLDDLVTLVTEIGDVLDVVMVPKVEGAVGHPLRRPAAGAAGGARGAHAPDPRPRDPGDRPGRGQRRGDRQRLAAHAGDLARAGGPGRVAADEDHARRRRASRLPRARRPGRRADRPSYQQDLWHYTIGRMVDACAAAGIFPYYGPFGDIKDVEGCEAQFRAAYLMGCVGTLVAAPGPDRDRQAGLLPRAGRGPFAKQGARGDPGRRAACT